MKRKSRLNTYICSRHVLYVILPRCHGEARELSAKSGTLAQKHTESLKQFILIKQWAVNSL